MIVYCFADFIHKKIGQMLFRLSSSTVVNFVPKKIKTHLAKIISSSYDIKATGFSSRGGFKTRPCLKIRAPTARNGGIYLISGVFPANQHSFVRKNAHKTYEKNNL